MGKGGTLSLTARKIQIGGTASADTLVLDPNFFIRGFGKYELNGYDSFVVTPGIQVAAWRPIFTVIDYTDLASGLSLPLEVRPEVQLRQGQRQPVDLSFSSVRPTYSIDRVISQSGATGDLEIGRGAAISVDAGGSVTLSAGRLVNISGTVTAHGGKIDVSLAASNASASDNSRSIWLRSGTLLDVSGATVRILSNPSGPSPRLGSCWRHCHGERQCARRNCHRSRSSLIDVSGASDDLDLRSGLAPSLTKNSNWVSKEIYSDAGSITFSALNGMSLNGSYIANGGGGTSRRGMLRLFGGNVVSPSTDTGIIEILAKAPVQPSGLPGSALNFGNNASVSAASLNAAGFDDIMLQGGHQVTLEGGTTLTARRNITIEAPNISVRAGAAGTALIQADAVTLGNSDDNKQTQTIATRVGAGILQIKTGLLDIVGNVSLLDVDRSVFDVAGDVRLTGRYEWTYSPLWARAF